MDQREFAFPAATALGLTDEPDEDDLAWEAFFEDAQTYAGQDDTTNPAAGPTRKGRRGGWKRDFKRNPDAVKKYLQNRYDYKESNWWKNFVAKAADARVPGSRISVEFHLMQGQRTIWAQARYRWLQCRTPSMMMLGL